MYELLRHFQPIFVKPDKQLKQYVGLP